MKKTKGQEQEQEMVEKLPPQCIDAEQIVLGAIMLDPLAIAKVMDTLKPENFYKQAHRYIYAAQLELFNKNQPVDIVTISEYLKKHDKLDLVGGRAYINDLALAVITSANIEYYSKIIIEKAVSRDLISIGNQIITIGFDEIGSQESLDQAEQLLFQVSQNNHKKEELTDIGSIAVDSYDLIEKRWKKKGELIGIPSGFYDLDNMTAGFQKSDLIIVAARPSMGKTAFCLNIAQEVGLRQKEPVAIFSLEMSREQLVQRMMFSEAEIDSQRGRLGNLQAEDWPKLTKAMSEMGEAPIYIDDSPGATITDIRAKTRRLISTKKKLGLIIIDYLQLMEGHDKKGNRELEIATISRGLKNLAREFSVPVIALSQLSRAVEQRQNKTPILSDLRESGSIENDADIVMFIYRDEYYNPDSEEKGKAKIIIAKQRNGPVGDVDLIFQKNITKFKNPVRTKTNLF